ncbi:MAG: S8 family serine peptidase, partial [Acidobacteria bacterium]|nr:S8 family serine peptidase [Acidobacteriota bacterium]
MSSISRRTLSFVLLGCCLLVAYHWQAASAQQEPLSTDTPQALLQTEKERARVSAAIEKRLQREGFARVIVGLRGAFKAEAELERQPDGAAAVRAQRAELARRQDGLLRALPGVRAASVKRFQFIPHIAFEVDAASWDALLQSELVNAIEEDGEMHATLTESTQLVGAQRAWAAGFSASGQVVAVLDTGVDKNHEFLRGKVVSEACYSTTSEEFTSVCPGGVAETTAPDSALPPSFTDGSWHHGTHVAGIVAGKLPTQPDRVAGVARDAQLIAIQVFSRKNDDGKTRAVTSDVVKGLERVYELRRSFNIAAVNLSLGSETKFSSACDRASSSYTNAINLLRAVGIATIAASGNEEYTDGISLPACISSAIAVGATTDGTDNRNTPNGIVDTVPIFSNSSPLVKLLAPGSWIASSVPNNRYAVSQGTSMAAPHVAGAFAVMRQKFPTATVDQITDMLAQSGKLITDPRNGVTKPRLQLDAALNQQYEELKHDDGTIEAGRHQDGLMVVNRFTPSRYPAKLKSLKIFFAKSDNRPDPQGQSIRIVAFQGGSLDTNPPATPVYLVDSHFTLPDISALGFYELPINNGPTIMNGDWYVGFQAPNPAAGVVFWYDSNGTQARRSYASTDNASTFSLFLTSNGQPVNAMIRAVIENDAPAPNCTYLLSAPVQSMAAAGGNGSFNVMAAAGCAWTARSNVSWLT